MVEDDVLCPLMKGSQEPEEHVEDGRHEEDDGGGDGDGGEDRQPPGHSQHHRVLEGWLDARNTSGRIGQEGGGVAQEEHLEEGGEVEGRDVEMVRS